MARGRRRQPDYSRLTPYERRIVKRIGMLPSEARERGISLAAARGHAPRAVEPGGERIPEHRLRDIRRQLRGEPTEAERNFLRRQAKRSGYDYDQLKTRFMQYSQTKRDYVRERQAAAHRRYAASRGRFRWSIDAPAGWGSAPAGQGAGAGVARVPRLGGAGGGGLGGAGDAGGDLDGEPDDLNIAEYNEFMGDWDDQPDFEDMDDAMLYYH